MFDKKIIVDDFIPHNYTLMDFLANIDINPYDQVISGDNLDQESIILNEELRSKKGVVLETPITVDLTFPINSESKFEQIVFSPMILNKGDNFEEIIIKGERSYIMEKNSFTITKHKDDKKTVEEEQIPYYREINKYHHPFIKRIIGYISERYSFLKNDNNEISFLSVNGEELNKKEFLKRLNKYISSNKVRIIKEAHDYDKATLFRNKTIREHMKIDFESASFGTMLTFERPYNEDEVQHVLVLMNAELESRKKLNISFKLNGDGYQGLAKVQKDSIYDINQSYRKARPVAIENSESDENYNELKSFLSTLNYVNYPTPEIPIPPNFFSGKPDGSDTDNIKWLMYDHIKNH